ncbi:MAG TPA: hypothetical protein PKN13_10305 [Accumulibacter sp.]|nr:hypothetical protein [Accumulibacter sp.]HMW17072.1 hypothetical protein [Accumulibacter sp.]HNC18209.1 hypothetical protein [Accumulibacter sp.]HND79873.1 hypothetical protein [Accumulibacter sp.]HNE12268.1 hypothetical protein [Accumulibacter sp.]
MNSAPQPHRFTITLDLLAPYLVHGSDPGHFGLEATLLRDHRGCPILPGTLLAGRIAEIWFNHGKQLGSPQVRKWLGQPGAGERGIGTDDGGRRARLQVADLRLQTIDGRDWEKQAQPLTHTRIALDDATGSVQRGALQVIEQIAPPGAVLRFTGHWRAWATPEEAEQLSRQLRAALLAQTQIGADRSVGLGVVRGATVDTAVVPPREDGQIPSPHGRCLRLTLTFDEPYCITERVHNGNLFKGGEGIPGGVILGALANSLCAAHDVARVAELDHCSALARHFQTLRCTHAYPTHQSNPSRPVPLPVSWVIADGTLQDAWRHKHPPAGLTKAPTFLLDWKNSAFALAMAETGWASPRRHLRVRTAMEDGRVLDKSLFAIEGRYSETENPLHWLADFWLPAHLSPAEEERLVQELARMTRLDLGPIGKTDAFARVRWTHSTATVLASPPGELRKGETIALRLNSPALLLDATALADQPIHTAPQAYGSAFADLCKQAGCSDALDFSHHFARERLVGGQATFHRYRLGQDGARDGVQARRYRPLLLTEAGSVFVFKVNAPADVAEMLQKWAQTGLPLPTDVVHRYGSTWQDHPYIPNNGYGEITRHSADKLAELSAPALQQAQT